MTAIRGNIRNSVETIVFDNGTSAGRRFDFYLILFILASVGVVMLESVRSIAHGYRGVLVGLEWFFTIVFTVEYIIRIWSARQRKAYVCSFFGIVDLLAILPNLHGTCNSRTKRIPDLSRITIDADFSYP